jgi:hypothetical protein
MFIVGLGATLFGFAIGIIVYRILRHRSGTHELSDLIALAGAIGSAVVFAFINEVLFGWYSIGLVIGFFAYFAAGMILYGKQELQIWLPGQINPTPTPTPTAHQDSEAPTH